MRVRINDVDHFLSMVEKSNVENVYVDDHQGWWNPFYHIWFIENNNCIEIKLRNLDTMLFTIAEITKMKKEMRVVKFLSYRRY